MRPGIRAEPPPDNGLLGDVMESVAASKTRHIQRAPRGAWQAVLTAMLVLLAAFLLAVPAQAATVTLKVVSARTEPAWPGAAGGVAKGAPVPAYKYIINIDNTGTTTQRSPAPGTGCNASDPGYPDSCFWTSIAGAQGHSPIYTQGDQADFTNGMAIPDGRYLISVLADNYKLDGRHFTVSGSTVSWEGKKTTGPTPDPANEVLVELQPWPLPDAQIQAAVFEDISPVNSAPDLPAEHGLAGFQGHIVDYLGEVTTDVYGAPLCDNGRCLSACYVVSGGVDVGVVQPVDKAGRCPTDPAAAGPMSYCDVGGGKRVPPYLTNTSATAPFNAFTCPLLSNGTLMTGAAPAGAAIEGKIKIPNIGTNRYALSVTPPDGSGWVQTTTLEGSHDWDAWVMEGATGLDTEFLIAGEPFPAIIFGYVPAPNTPSAEGSALPVSAGGTVPNLNGTATIKGLVEAVKVYVPTNGGIGGLPGSIWGGMQGAKLDKPIPFPKVTLTSLDNGDTIVWSGEGDANGNFSIPNVPAGTYTLTWWDEPQNTILDLVNVTVADGETIDMGILPLTGWWTFYEGYVFNDLNRNGIKDPGEPGLPGYTLTLRKRENSLMDRGTTVTTTEADGYYKFEAAYPMTQFLVMEAYDDTHFTTGITFQADNQPTPTTLIGPGVDVSVHPIINLGGRLDWGKHVYDPTGRNGIDPRNGGIVGTVSYDTTRNELDPRFAAVEDWQPSIPDLLVKLYKPAPCASTDPALCDATGRYALATDGSIAKGPLLNTYITETWHRPTHCVARGVDGNPMVHGVDENVLPADPTKGCIEAPLLGVQFWGGADPATGEFPGVEVNGNYGFGDGCFNGTLDITDPANPVCTGGTFDPLPAADYLVEVVIPNDAKGKPLYKVTREEDINIGNGDLFVPAIPPSPCVGALHVVDSSGNANFPGGPGTSPYEGTPRPMCDLKLVSLGNGKSIAPAFNLYTDVPVPGRHWFIIIDDLNFSSNWQSTTFGEKAGMPFVPVGIYDYTNRLIKTVESDYNGLADVLLPSTNRINCPTPSGVCANLFRYVGNDPGVPGRLNLNYNPSFRTISAEFEVLPGLLAPADLAPTQVGVTVQLPGGQTTQPVACMLEDTKPQIYRVNQPYVRLSGNAAARTITITGTGFGAGGTLYLNNAPVATSGWTANQIVFTVPTTMAAGPKQLSITAQNGESSVNGLTLHVLGTGYNPNLYEVGPGVVNARYQPAETLPLAANHAIQNALDDAATYVAGANNREALVVVYPNNPSLDNPRQNPRGAYYENLIITSKVRLQGVGPGAPDGSVPGSILDGGAFPGDGPVATDWYTRILRETAPDAAGNAVPTWAGNPTIYDGAVISLYLPSTGRRAFPTSNSLNTAPMIDGFDIRGGDQAGFPGNINAIGGGATGQPPNLITQGGAIYANAYARNLRITNNVVQNNGGAYGSIRIGTPDLTGDPSSHNDGVTIGFNRIVQNAGTNQAGGIGLFAGSNNYAVFGNDICGNFSAEYGGGISHVGLSDNGQIYRNRIYFNRSYDEGGGVMIAGALPATTTSVSPGAGSGVAIYGNLVQANLSNDDGGGIRFLMAGSGAMNVYNNVIVNNISTHEGGGISINDTSNVRVFNNTIMKNLTTATAITSNGSPAPAGLSTSMNSALFQATLPGGSPLFSDPLLFNNIFWDNRAGTRALTQVTGLSATDADLWDLGIADGPGLLSPTNSIIQQTTRPFTPDASNRATDPAVVQTYDVGVTFNTWRNNPAFLGAIMISADLPPSLMGNYHITSNSPAVNIGAASKSGANGVVNAPADDIDRDARPANAIDAGADELAAAAANLGIAITDNVTAVQRGQTLTYTVTVSNAGPSAVQGAVVTSNLSNQLTGVSWSCASGCTVTSGTGNINTFVSLANGASATITVSATVAATAPLGGTIGSSVTVAGSNDPNPANNTATDTDNVVVPLPALPVLDNFNRANATTLGANWSQATTGNAVIRVNSQRATCALAFLTPNCNGLVGQAVWNGATNVFGPTQGAAVTFQSLLLSSLYLKASGGTAAAPQNYIRVRPGINQVIVESTVNSGGSFTNLGTLAATGLGNGSTLTAVANADGSVDVWNGNTYLGRSGTSAFTGGGRIGMQMVSTGQVDNFSGGTLP